MGVPLAIACTGRLLMTDPGRPAAWGLAALALAEIALVVRQFG